MAKTFPDRYTTTRECDLKCGCSVSIEVEIDKNVDLIIIPTIVYCKLHILGFEMMETFREELSKSILDSQ